MVGGPVPPPRWIRVLESQSVAVAHADVAADARRLALISAALSEELVCAVTARAHDAQQASRARSRAQMMKWVQ
ncbi:hypothetical protein KBX06_14940 [Micromonospora sp. C31]|uniref:hypothetical protein n=1 Tax=Micromonospora sp. C31 TaxID=2824876 RepID=UPI001B362B22|nr:hypothetical protein [Micromonospora sp. C31]MBQ1074451.1 hypothetical protein [Micromonospora sp. C31]